MVGGVLYVVAALVGLVVGVWGLRFILEPARTLNLTIFRPYRSLPWPRGVQEDDSVRFNWSAAASRRVPTKPSWADVVVRPTGRPPAGDAESRDASVEEVYGETVMVEPLRATVHRAPH